MATEFGHGTVILGPPPTISFYPTEIHAMRSYLLANGIDASWDSIIARINAMQVEHHYEVCNRRGMCTCAETFRTGYQHPLPQKVAA